MPAEVAVRTTPPQRTLARRSWLAPGLFLAASAALAAWAWTRSDALDRAGAIAARARTPEALAHAVRLALDHLDRQPWNRDAARLAATSLSRMDRPDDAEPLYRRIGRLTLVDQHARASAIVRANRRDEAIAAYREILAERPDDPEALRLLAGLHYSRNETGPAVEAAQRLVQLPEGAREGHRLLGTIFAENGDPVAAIEQLLAVLRLDPGLARTPADGRVPFYTNLARSLIAVGRAEEAVSHLEAGLSAGESALLRTILGQARRQLGDIDGAESEWRRVVSDDPGMALAWLELGRSELGRGRIDDAITALDRAASQAPDDYQVLFALRSAHLRRGDTARAEELAPRVEAARARTAPRPGGMGPRPMVAP